MIFREIKITGRDTLKVSIPESWDDVTFKQFRLIANEEDELTRLSILTGIPTDLFNKYPELADFYVWVGNNLRWSNEWTEDKSDVECFLLGDDIFHFPKDIGMLSVGLFKDIQNEAKDNSEDITSIYPLICASYYQLLKDGEYDYVKAEGYKKLFEGQPCRKVYNAAGFFLSKVTELRNGMKVKRKRQAILTIKRWLGLIGFQRFSGLKLRQPN